MRKTITIILLCFLLTGLCFSFSISTETGLDQYFDEYGIHILWWQERLHLDNFAYYLKKNPDQIGYIAFYKGPNESLKKARLRINRATQYLLTGVPRSVRIKKQRIVIIYAGERENPTTILQPVNKDKPAPRFY